MVDLNFSNPLYGGIKFRRNSMASVNKVILVGTLGRDPEVRHTGDGTAIANFSIATNESWKDKSGQKQERTEWHNIVTYRKLAEIAEQYLKKGSSVFVEGSLATRKWTDKNGVERYTTEIRCDSFQMLGGRNTGNQNAGDSQTQRPQQSAAPSQQAPSNSGGNTGYMPDDAPFDDIPFLRNNMAGDVIIKKLNRAGRSDI
jgi:single-strand DNA-binding protein